MRFRILRFYKFFGLLVMLGLTTGTSLAQTASVEGRVRSADGSIPPGPKVVLIDNENGITREPDTIDVVNGRFEIKNVQEGVYTIVACAGTIYNPSKLKIDVRDGKARAADLTLTVTRQRTVVQGKIKTGNIDVSALAYECEVASVKTDASGHFRFDALPVPPKEYTVRTQVLSGKVLQSNSIPVSAGRETEVALTFEGNKGLDVKLVAELVYPHCDPTQPEQTDLSGTYTGKVNYPEAGLATDATLIITGNDFTLTSGSVAQSGRITAVTTCGYTGATMMFGDLTTPAPGPSPPPPLPAVSLRVRKIGDRVTLITVPGETREFSFGSANATWAWRKHRAKAKAQSSTPP